MKNIFEVGVMVLLASLLAAPAAQAQFAYTTNNGAIIITGYTGSGGAVIIPHQITGLPVTGIADWAFYSTGVINVTIADTVTNIGHGAFFDCESLTNMAIGANVASIGDWAFENCTGLGSVTIPSSVTNIGISAFVICVSLIAINVDAQNAFYSSLNGVLFDKAQATLIEYPGGKIGSYDFPGTVTSIAQYAFASCTNLTRITISASVTNIGDLAFLDCYYLTTATVASGMLTFGESAFGGCLRLTTVYFQGNAPNADDSLFSTAGAVNEPGTVYYLPGTSGWSNSCGGEPAVLWNPLIQTADGSFGVRTNQFGFNITGTPKIPIVVQGADNLANPVWTSLQSLTLTNGSHYFSEPFQPAIPARFYRITSQ